MPGIQMMTKTDSKNYKLDQFMHTKKFSFEMVHSTVLNISNLLRNQNHGNPMVTVVS